jgi:hypothetical protein
MKNNYKVGDGRLEKSNRQNVVDILYSSREENKVVKKLFYQIILL